MAELISPEAMNSIELGMKKVRKVNNKEKEREKELRAQGYNPTAKPAL